MIGSMVCMANITHQLIISLFNVIARHNVELQIVCPHSGEYPVIQLSECIECFTSHLCKHFVKSEEV